MNLNTYSFQYCCCYRGPAANTAAIVTNTMTTTMTAVATTVKVVIADYTDCLITFTFFNIVLGHKPILATRHDCWRINQRLQLE